MAENPAYGSEALIRDFFKTVGTSYSTTADGVKSTVRDAVLSGGFEEEFAYTTRKGRTVTRTIKSWSPEAGGKAIASVFSRDTARGIVYALVLDHDFATELRKEYETPAKMLEFTVQCLDWMNNLKSFLFSSTIWGRLFTIGEVLYSLPAHYKAIRKSVLTVSPEHDAMGQYLRKLVAVEHEVSLQVYGALENRGLESLTQRLNDTWQVKSKDYHDSQCESRHRGAVGGDADKAAKVGRILNSMAAHQYAEQAAERIAIYIQGQLVLQLLDRVVVESAEHPYMYWGCSFSKGHENPYPTKTLKLSNYNEVKNYAGTNPAIQEVKQLVLQEEARINKEVTQVAVGMANSLQQYLARLKKLTQQSLRYGEYRTRERSLVCE